MTKAKLLRGMVLALLPIILYYAVFLAFEPNNYFGLKKEADGTDIMAALRAYPKAPGNAIILGDSRVAKFDPALTERLTGRAFANLAYGGASLTEQLDLLAWVRRQNPSLDEVLFMASFYTLNQSYNHDRAVVRAASNPLAYLTNLGYNINMLTNLRDHLLPGAQVGDEGETMDPADYAYVDYTDPATGQTHAVREKIAEHLENLRPRIENWRLNGDALARLCEAIEDCRAEGIRVTVVLPPVSAEVREYLIGSYGIAPQMAPALKALAATGADIQDYEFSRTDTLQPNQFYDGFHLDTERGLYQWQALVFGEMAAARDFAMAGGLGHRR